MKYESDLSYDALRKLVVADFFEPLTRGEIAAAVAPLHPHIRLWTQVGRQSFNGIEAVSAALAEVAAQIAEARLGERGTIVDTQAGRATLSFNAVDTDRGRRVNALFVRVSGEKIEDIQYFVGGARVA